MREAEVPDATESGSRRGERETSRFGRECDREDDCQSDFACRFLIRRSDRGSRLSLSSTQKWELCSCRSSTGPPPNPPLLSYRLMPPSHLARSRAHPGIRPPSRNRAYTSNPGSGQTRLQALSDPASRNRVSHNRRPPACRRQGKLPWSPNVMPCKESATLRTATLPTIHQKWKQNFFMPPCVFPPAWRKKQKAGPPPFFA